MNKYIFFFVCIALVISGCSGLKVIDPNKPNNKGTLQIDYSDGGPKLFGTYTCTMVGANGQRVYATGKSEEEARKEAIAKCQDQTAVSFCNVSKMSCEKN
ncbi:MAG: hypothetical protein ACOYOK_12670 [Pseudobdellovibrionaceae bacterium]